MLKVKINKAKMTANLFLNNLFIKKQNKNTEQTEEKKGNNLKKTS